MRLIGANCFGGAAFLFIGAAAGLGRNGCPGARKPARRPPPSSRDRGYSSRAEGAAVEALVDRLIPPDPETPGGKDAGCAVFIDRQLAGPYGRADGLYRRPPFIKGTKQQGPQDADGPRSTTARRWRRSTDIAGRRNGGKRFARLHRCHKDDVLGGLENGTGEARRRRRQGVLRASSSRTPRRASSPIRSMAAIATWRAGR